MAAHVAPAALPHSAVQIGTPQVWLRGPVFMINLLAVWGLWGWLLARP